MIHLSSFPINKKAFTLIELLVVIVTIGILASALIPRIQNMQAKARDARRAAEMSQIYAALRMYFEDRGSLPSGLGAGVDNNQAGLYDFSAQSGSSYKPLFLPWLVTAGIMTSVPVDPLNTMSGNHIPTETYSYVYGCYSALELAYYKETVKPWTGAYTRVIQGPFSSDILMNKCLPAMP